MVAAIVAAVTLLPALAAFDTTAAPLPRRIFASSCGRYGAFVEVKTKERQSAQGATVSTFAYDGDGKEQPGWRTEFNYVPNRVVISERGRVVALDEYGKQGHAHAVVILDDKGQVLSDYPLSKLLSREEIELHITETVCTRVWLFRANIWFLRELFVIELPWGRVLMFDLDTGKLSSSDSESPLPGLEGPGKRRQPLRHP